MKTILKRASLFLCMFAGFVMLLLLVYLGVTNNIEVYQERQNKGYKQVEDYEYFEVEDSEAPLGIKKEYRWILEDTSKGDTCFAFYVVHQYVEVLIDGQMVYSLRYSENNQMSKTTGSNWVMIPLYPEDTGKEICIVITPIYKNYQDRTFDFLIGSQLEIYLQRLQRDLPQLILGVMAVFAGIVFVVITVYNYYKKNRQADSLLALGIFSIMMGLWRLTDTRSTPLLMPDKPVFLFYISIAMLMFGVIPLAKSLKRRFSEKVGLFLDACCLFTSIVCLVQIILQILGIQDFRENLTVTHITLLINSLIIIGGIFYDKLKLKKNEKGYIGRRFSLICVAGVFADTLAYYIKGNSSGLIFTLSAFFCYTIYIGIVMLFEYQEQEKRVLEQEKKLKEQEAALASSRIVILLSQIQPHFMLNSLISIKSLCKKNAEEAAEALDRFAGYLRGSMNSLKEKKCILFENELKHVENYLYLEQKRFGDELQVIYDIQESDFFIPALSVQPMVENAVRHGVRQRLGGGCVSISSYSDEAYYVVQITDDGVGFDVEKLNTMDDSHVGIVNVRSRLQMMCNGELTIKSVPGQGTTILIKIPKKGILTEEQ